MGEDWHFHSMKLTHSIFGLTMFLPLFLIVKLLLLCRFYRTMSNWFIDYMCSKNRAELELYHCLSGRIFL